MYPFRLKLGSPYSSLSVEVSAVWAEKNATSNCTGMAWSRKGGTGTGRDTTKVLHGHPRATGALDGSQDGCAGPCL